MPPFVWVKWKTARFAQVKSQKQQFVWSQAPDIFNARVPRRIEDLGAHKLLHCTNQANGAVWKMTSQTGEKRQIRTTGNFTVNDGQSLLNAAINGLGIAYLPSFLYASALAEPRCRCDARIAKRNPRDLCGVSPR